MNEVRVNRHELEYILDKTHCLFCDQQLSGVTGVHN